MTFKMKVIVEKKKIWGSKIKNNMYGELMGMMTVKICGN